MARLDQKTIPIDIGGIYPKIREIFPLTIVPMYLRAFKLLDFEDYGKHHFLLDILPQHLTECTASHDFTSLR
jgi:hypothetical protein